MMSAGHDTSTAGNGPGVSLKRSFLTWEDRLPSIRVLPCVPVAIAPATVCTGINNNDHR